MMLRYAAVLVAIAMMVALPATAQTEDAAEGPPKVTMTADHWDAAKVAAEITEQTGVQVSVTEWTEGSVTGTLADFELEDAVSSLAQAAQASWMRFYMLETAPPEEPYSAPELLIMLEETRGAWLEGLSDEQRATLFGGFRGQRGGEGGPGGPPGEGQPGEGQPAAEGAAPPEAAPAAEAEGEGAPQAEGQPGEGRPQFQRPSMEGPGGAIARPPAPEGAQEGDRGGRFGGFGNSEDPLRGLLLPGRTDTITLELTDAPLQETLSAFTLSSRFLVLADEDLSGAVSMQLEEAPLSEALDAIAEASGAQWRTVYIVSAPRQLTEEEIAQREATREQRREEQFNQRWAEFWAMSPQQRAAEIQERVAGMERMAQRMEERRQRMANDPNADPERAARRAQRGQRRTGRMFDRMVSYSTQLTPEQRLELKPLLQAMARMRGGQ